MLKMLIQWQKQESTTELVQRTTQLKTRTVNLGCFRDILDTGLVDYLSPLHTESPALSAKLHIVKVSNSVLCITLIIHVDKRKACAAKH